MFCSVGSLCWLWWAMTHRLYFLHPHVLFFLACLPQMLQLQILLQAHPPMAPELNDGISGQRRAFCEVTSGNAVIDRYLFNFMVKTSWVLGCLIPVEFKGLRESNQTYPWAAILDIWVNSGENMYQQSSYNSKAKNNQLSLKGLIKKSCLSDKLVAKQGVSPCASFYSGKSKCKMIPFNNGSHLSILKREEER